MTRVSFTGDPDYRFGVEGHDALRAFLPAIREQKLHVRHLDLLSPSIRREMGPEAGAIGTNRDRVVIALVNKACNTHAAIRALTDLGHGDDAMALARILLENAWLLRWLLLDPIVRLDMFSVSSALFSTRWAQLAIKHYSAMPDVVKNAKASLTPQVLATAKFFGSSRHKWARTLCDGKFRPISFEAMMREAAEAAGDVSGAQREVVYHLHSGFVHSTASSMRSFKSLGQEQFFNIDLVGVDRVMLGSDYCFDMGYERPREIIDGLKLPAADRTASTLETQRACWDYEEGNLNLCSEARISASKFLAAGARCANTLTAAHSAAMVSDG